MMAIKNKPVILWVDLRHINNGSCVNKDLYDIYDIHILTDSDGIQGMIEQCDPLAVCFNYDFPDQADLTVLRDTKLLNPSLPLIMLVVDQSIELAIWGLRSRVWNYFVTPVVSADLVASIGSLSLQPPVTSDISRHNFMPLPPLPNELRPYTTTTTGLSKLCATNYVKKHLSRKITVEEVAKCCGMSKSHFSRTFKKQSGVTFQEYLIQQRMNKAVELLKNTDLLVTQIAFAVGYCELSNFTASFQRVFGVRPSHYRKSLQVDPVLS